jgi:hypothetical protein
VIGACSRPPDTSCCELRREDATRMTVRACGPAARDRPSVPGLRERRSEFASVNGLIVTLGMIGLAIFLCLNGLVVFLRRNDLHWPCSA